MTTERSVHMEQKISWRKRPFQEKLVRAVMHIPAGVFTVFLGYLALVLPMWYKMPMLVFIGIALMVIWFLGFMGYELNEDLHLKDGAFLDIYGFLVGLALGSYGLFHYIVFGFTI